MKIGRAFFAGVVGGAVMSGALALARASGMPRAELEMTLGTFFLFPTTETLIIGLAIHLLLSGFIGLIYRFAFERIAHRGGWLIGGGFGVIHALIAGFALGGLPMVHPRMPNIVAEPGMFMASMGMAGVVVFVSIHIAYGVVVGGMYGHVVHPAAPRATR